MTSQQQLVCDSSTLANFIQWASAISNFFRTAGWTNSADTGQLGGAGAGNWAAVTAVPGSGLFIYEIFEPNDGLTNFYVKLAYGNVSGTNCPGLQVSIGAGTDGAGNLTGYSMAAKVCTNSYTPPSNVTQYECNFSGAAGRMGVMMWRNAPVASQQFFAIERSVSASGAYTGSYVTLLVSGSSGGQAGRGNQQGTLVFGVGIAPNNLGNGPLNNTYQGGWNGRVPDFASSSSSSFNGSIAFDPIAPAVGYFDYPMTAAGVANPNDFAEAVTFQLTLYGATRTYLPSKQGVFAWNSIGAGLFGQFPSMMCMRFD